MRWSSFPARMPVVRLGGRGMYACLRDDALGRDDSWNGQLPFAEARPDGRIEGPLLMINRALQDGGGGNRTRSRAIG